MAVKSDWWIENQCRNFKMIWPFEVEKVRQIDDKKVISYGLSSYGYDLRIGRDFKVFVPTHCTVVDPKNFDEKVFVTFTDVDEIVIPPNSFALGYTVEYIRVPPDVLVLCVGKSSYARCGIIVNPTPFEPCWEGHATIEISNTTPLPAKIYSGEGICQAVFIGGDRVCKTNYGENGKYQKQGPQVVLPKV
jgi:dCTP deaminase